MITLRVSLRSLNFIVKRTSTTSIKHLARSYRAYKDFKLQKLDSKAFPIPGRNMATTSKMVKNIGIDELKKYQQDPRVLIIDVREVEEIKETGILPGAINIPLAEVLKALQAKPEMFQNNYKRPKPSPEEPIIFSCRSGKRSTFASETAISLGFTNVINYNGGWLDWERSSSK